MASDDREYSRDEDSHSSSAGSARSPARPRPRDEYEFSDGSPDPPSWRQIRFQQLREVMAVACLLVLLGLITYHAVLPQTEWATRTGDIQLLILLMSGLLGVNFLLDHYQQIARVLGAVLTAYANGFRPPGGRQRRHDRRRSERRDHTHDHDYPRERDQPRDGDDARDASSEAAGSDASDEDEDEDENEDEDEGAA